MDLELIVQLYIYTLFFFTKFNIFYYAVLNNIETFIREKIDLRK